MLIAQTVGLMFKTQKIQKQELHLLLRQQEELLPILQHVEFTHLQGQEHLTLQVYLQQLQIMH